MPIQHLKSSQLITSRWSGGTTTQLFIYPPGSEYSKLNFLFRISTATTEVEESDFTILPGVIRQLMVLKGRLVLFHNSKPGDILNKFECSTFSGDCKTTGSGKVTDFNLMLREPATGNISVLILAAGIKKETQINPVSRFTGFFVFKGSVDLILNDEKIYARSGDFLWINDHTSENINFTTEQGVEIIEVNVIY